MGYKFLVSVFVFALMSVSLVGCGGGSVSSSSASASTASERVEASSAATESLYDASKWPSDVMGKVPQPVTNAEIDTVSTAEIGGSVKLVGMTMDEAVQYGEAIKAAGFNAGVVETKGSDRYHLGAHDADNDSAFIEMAWFMENGQDVCTITYMNMSTNR